MHDGEDPRLREILLLGLPVVGEQPAHGRGVLGQRMRRIGADDGVNLTGVEHGSHVLLQRHAVQDDALRQVEVDAGRPLEAVLCAAEPLDGVRADAVLVEQHPAREHGGGHGVLRHADLLAG